MFRRKEESATETSAEESTAQQTAANAAPVAAPHEAAPVSPVAAAAPASQQQATQPVSYTPAARPAQPQASYRPAQTATAAEFNRAPGMIARSAASAEAARTASAVTTSAVSASVEKAPVIKPNRRVLTVGNDILLKGEIATCDRLLIEGRVEAKLSDVHTVEIAECGSFKGTAEVEDAEISGIFEGDLIVRNRLVIYASGEVRGNIGYGEVEIERGGRLTGQIKTVTPAAKTAAQGADKARSVVKEPVAA